MAVSPGVYQLDALVLPVVVLAPAPRVLPDVAPLGHVRHGEVGGDLVGAHGGRGALGWVTSNVATQKNRK